MGCMDREITEDEVAFRKRKKEILEDLRTVSLSKLTVDDILIICGAIFHRHFGLGPADLDSFEKIIKRAKQ